MTIPMIYLAGIVVWNLLAAVMCILSRMREELESPPIKVQWWLAIAISVISLTWPGVLVTAILDWADFKKALRSDWAYAKGALRAFARME